MNFDPSSVRHPVNTIGKWGIAQKCSVLWGGFSPSALASTRAMIPKMNLKRSAFCLSGSLINSSLTLGGAFSEFAYEDNSIN